MSYIYLRESGGGILGGVLLGHTCVCAVEFDQYRREILLQRQRDGILPRFPIWDDVRTFDGKPWRGKVDCVCGGFPCTDISAANINATNIDGAESSLWRDMARIIGEVRPRYVFVENSPMLTTRGLDRVLADLAALGYACRWCVMGGEYLGKTRRQRIWILGKSDEFDCNGLQIYESADSQKQLRRDTVEIYEPVSKVHRRFPIAGVRRMDYGIPHWVDRFKAVGMAQIPIVAANAFNALIAD